MQQITYAEADRQFIGLIKTKAHLWSTRGAGPFDDLVQEGRLTLHRVVQTHDPARGPMIKLLGVALDNRYRTLRAAAMAQVRMPYIWERDLVEDTWERVPVTPTPLSCYATADTPGLDLLLSTDAEAAGACATGAEACEAALEREAKLALAKWKTRLMNRLTDRQRAVLDCYTRPDPALLVVARNMTEGEDDAAPEITIPIIAAFLRLTKNQVDYALHGVRKVAEGLFIETEQHAVELIKHAIRRQP